jgi:hypothetical protein
LLICSLAIQAQTAPPSAYTIQESAGGGGNSVTTTVYRDGPKAVLDVTYSAQTAGGRSHRSVSLYDLKEHTSYSWDPASTPPSCSAGTFSGDWGDPFAMTAELSAQIDQGKLKVTGAQIIDGILTKIYTGGEAQSSMKVWFDQKDGLVMRALFGPASGPMQTLVDIKKVSLAAPPAGVFVLPAACAQVHRAPTEAELIAAETGDSAANFVNAIYGPGSKNSCTVVLRVVRAGTMAPITTKIQVAIDTSYDMEKPPHYEFGMGRDGSQSFAGGGIREITNQVRNGMVRIDNPPAYFNLGVNLMKPGTGAGMGLIYRQCFAPQTVLLYVVKNPDQPSEGGDWLWAKAGKYAAVPAH